MKIAICNVQEFNPTIGGIERVSVSLAEGLIKEGVEVLFIACRKSPYSKRYTLPAKQMFLPQSLDYCSENVQALAHILKAEKVDILLNQNSHSGLYNRTCYEAKLVSGVKLISVLHFSPDMRIKGNRHLVNFSYLSLKENLVNALRDVCTRFPLRYITMHDQRRMYRNLYLYSDKVVLLSNEFKESYIKLSGIKEASKLTAINNMLSFPYEKRDYPKKKQILWCGRLLFSQKRPDRILLIWKKLQGKLPDWNLVIVGDGPFSEQMRQLSEHLSLERIEFAGFKDPVPYYKESSIFCMTSNHEGWGLVLTEAMQHGCIPVAFDSFESIHEIIEDGKNGFLVKPFDTDMYANRILHLAENNRKEYVINVINSMERLTPQNIVKLWIELFNSILTKQK
ncbi:glycosyltransferase [Bacteroides uniformis]|uniref:glycosyltransferase n=1 Tax=Bacteroides uniformis TaxID=820 RepID=UPI0039B63E0E